MSPPYQQVAEHIICTQRRIQSILTMATLVTLDV